MFKSPEEVTRRIILQLLGIGGVSLFLNPGGAAARTVAIPVTTCPPPTGAIPNLPALAQLVDYLIFSKGNRETFNNTPDLFLGSPSKPGCYGLSGADRQALLTFNPPEVFKRIQDDIGADPPPEAWAQLYDLIYRTRLFWDSWKPGDDDYPDTYECDFEHSKPQYSYPNPELYELIAGPTLSAGKNQVSFTGQGILDKFEVVFEHKTDSSKNVGPAGVTVSRESGSTFRCARITAEAVLIKGEEYRIVVKNVDPAMTFVKKLPITAV